jgi:hypothetical protein
VPLPIARGRKRVDREDLVAGRAQRGHPRTPVGLDPHHHLSDRLFRGQLRPGRGRVVSDQRMQPGDAIHALRQPGPDQPPTIFTFDLNFMVIFSPVVWVPETRLTSCDLAIFVDEAAETVEAPHVCGVGSVLFWERT